MTEKIEYTDEESIDEEREKLINTLADAFYDADWKKIEKITGKKIGENDDPEQIIEEYLKLHC